MPRPARLCFVPSLALLCACAPARVSALPQAAPPDTGTIVVSGSAQVSVPVDHARVRLAVETQAPTAAEAVAANAESMTAALSAVRDALSGGGRVTTKGYSLSPVYRQPGRDEGGERRITGYTALNHVEAVIEDLDRVGAVLDAGVAAGVNRVVELSFYAEDTRAAHLEALREATARAGEEARVLAEALGVPLGPPLLVQSSGQPMPSGIQFRSLAQAAVETPIETGDQVVSASVTITYRIGGGSGR